MLPQVANHILHHTTRAVAAAQNQAGHTIRNVLGLQSTGAPSSSSTSLGPWNGAGSSSWGNGHAGAGGGAKYHTGSRFYSGYTGPGRAVTQANTSTNNDSGTTQTDDNDEIRPQPAVVRSARKPRSRRHSFSLGSDAHAQSERAESIGVLQAVQLHARSRHAFAEPPRPQHVTDDLANPLVADATPRLARRNSTASTVSASSASEARDALPPRPPTPAHDITDPSKPQTVLPPTTGFDTVSDLVATSVRPDGYAVHAELQRLRDPKTKSGIPLWNSVLANLAVLRGPRESVAPILQVYNDILARSLKPNVRTYEILLEALTARDREVYWLTKSLETRIARRKAIGLDSDPDNYVDEQTIHSLAAENNFASAMSLFRAANAIPSWNFHRDVYTHLLRSCAHHNNVDSAIFIFAHLERKPFVPQNASLYAQLAGVYLGRNDWVGVDVVFEEFKKVCQAEKLSFSGDISARASHISVWNRAIEAQIRAGKASAALGLLEQMLDTAAGVEFGLTDVPAPALSTYKHLIRGFYKSGDISSALVWFERLLEQGKPVNEEFKPTIVPPLPDSELWADVIDALGEAGRVDDINRLMRLPNRHRGARTAAYVANIRYLQGNQVDNARAHEILDFVVDTIVLHKTDRTVFFLSDLPGLRPFRGIVELYAKYGSPEKALAFIEKVEVYRPFENSKTTHMLYHKNQMEGAKDLTLAVLYDNGVARDIPLPIALGLASVWAGHGLHIEQPLASAIHRAYIRARAEGALSMLTAANWNTIVLTLVGTDAQFSETLVDVEERAEPLEQRAQLALDLLANMAKAGLDPSLASSAKDSLLDAILARRSPDETSDFMFNLGPSFAALLEGRKEFLLSHPAPPPVEQPIPVGTDSRIDDYHSRFVDEYALRRNTTLTPMNGFERFESGVRMGLYPNVEVIGRLIESLGRMRDMERVSFLYQEGNNMLALLEHDQQAHLTAWAALENSMIIARGHSGDGSNADIHRIRLLEQGMSPTADGYGALIQCIKDTTDDTARAMAYFEESQVRGVRPNIYLYNTTISKLAKARKADYAIELFQEMKGAGLQPTSITYGAVIAACCRVGDSASAETLFEEMTSKPNFKPRVPPYNTMMQFYVQTKPNRSRFLHYHARLVAAGIKPTAHTYKLLLDVHGTIEPVDLKSMEKTFTQLQRDRSIQVQGSHWASLINAYGCVNKDLDKATAVFDSIATHPSTLASGLRLPDAVTFEALINVLVTLRRADLIPEYVSRLEATGVHMTAYIANLLIRGYAAVGDIGEARKVFDSLVDPPVGVAAPNNHAPHDVSATQPVAHGGYVYREPSTWEAMVRAELGSGNRDHAIALLDRVRARQYPESIYNRISGIMLDDSVSPWPSEPASSELYTSPPASSGTHSP